MAKILIMSLGGSPEPLKKSIELHKPERVIFLASQDSVLKAAEVLSPLDLNKPKTEFEITEDPNLMFECYKAAIKCVERARRFDVPAQEITVDYTGGTKVMTAALILATIGEPFRFNYVGGERRTKAGLGVVEDGYEKMFAEMSPWSIFAEEERRQVVTLFNRRRFSAVVQIIGDCLKRQLPLEIEQYFSFVSPLAEGFFFWDQFQHAVALRKIKNGREALVAYLRLKPDEKLEEFLKSIEKYARFLEELISETKDVKKLHPILVDDLLNNARRRMADKRYDDAAARVYRALELYGQICFFEEAGCNTDSVKPDIIPEALRAEFIRKYMDSRNNLLKLPMTATFEYLKEKGNQAGVRFFENIESIKKIQNSRNASILAHGIRPVDEKAIHSIFQTVSGFVKFTNEFDFPVLP